jgi:hypothetical protein
MNNKTLMVAGISALAITTLSVSGLVSAANTSSTSTPTQSQVFKWDMKGERNEKWNFWPGHGQGFRWEHEWRWMQNSAIKAAINANDYNAFVTARKADTNKPSDVTQPTQEQFNQIVIQSKKRVEIESALKANNYDAFVKATTPTKEEFAKQVTEYNIRTAIDTAIKAKDYNAFTTAIKSDTNRPSDAKIPTQEQFNQLVSRSTETITQSNQ